MDCIQHMCIYRLLKQKELLLWKSLFVIKEKKVPLVMYLTQEHESSRHFLLQQFQLIS